MSQTANRLTKQVVKTVSIEYLLHIPKAAKMSADKTWPVILFLHGSGERGDDVEKVKEHGLPAIVSKDDDFPFIVISPQCPEDDFWATHKEAVMAVLEHVLANTPADPKRVYLTGLSMGGYGAWGLPADYPVVFAALHLYAAAFLPPRRSD